MKHSIMLVKRTIESQAKEHIRWIRGNRFGVMARTDIEAEDLLELLGGDIGTKGGMNPVTLLIFILSRMKMLTFGIQPNSWPCS